MERRKFIRFQVDLKIETNKQSQKSNPGFAKDFSHDGLRAAFNEFEFEPGSTVVFRIKDPASQNLVPGVALIVWKKLIDGKWNVGFILKEFSPANKADILEYGYTNWLKQNMPSS